MKKKLILIPLLVLALLVSVGIMAPVSAAGPPVIDGVFGEGEWDGAVVIPVASGMGTVHVIAERDYLYVLLGVLDSNDARTQYEGERGNDQISININPTAGENTWGFPYDLIFETSALSGGRCSHNCPADGGHHCLPWNPKVNSGVSNDGWSSRWFPNDAQQTLPSDLESATVYSGGRRITEWKIPLISINPLPSTLKVGGAIDVGDGNSYVYPVGLDWNAPETFIDIPVPPASTRSTDAFDVFVRFGYDSTRYDIDGALRGNIEAAGDYNDTQYMLEIPAGSVVTGTTGRINWLWLDSITDGVLTFAISGGGASFSEPCTLYIAEGGRIYQDYWTEEWLGAGKWVEVGTFTSIVDGEAHLE